MLIGDEISLDDLPIETQLGARGESLTLKATLSAGERIQFMVVNPTNIQFWGVPNKIWKIPAWQRLSRSYLEEIVTGIPGASININSAGMDIKLAGRYLKA